MIGLAVATALLISAIALTDSGIGVFAAIPLLALFSPASGAVYGAVVALRRRSRGIWAFGPWMNAFLCLNAAGLGAFVAWLAALGTAMLTNR